MKIKQIEKTIYEMTMYEIAICSGVFCGLTTIGTFIHAANLYVNKIEVMSPKEWEKYCKKSNRKMIIV